MDEDLPRLQERQLLERPELRGLDYPSSYMCRSRRGMKPDESKETYKLPHRLIEKKRRDRINECIAQLKDLLPEHLKLTTLGHLEKAVVLELTLKHLKALTALTEQQHQKIIALQNGERSVKSPLQSDLEAFRSGFHTCTKEVLQYLCGFESWTTREQQCVQLINHLHAVCTRFLPGPQLSAPKLGGMKGPCPLASLSPGGERAGGGGVKQESQTNCVPVIQRLQNWNNGGGHHPLPPGGLELGGENDTDTDSGYGGECEGKVEGRRSRGGLIVKQEPSGARQDQLPRAKRLKLDCSSTSPSTGPSPAPGDAATGRPDPALLGSLMALGGLGIGVGGGAVGSLLGQPPATPFCLPFYFISPSAAAACVQPFLEKIHLEKHLYPSAPVPLVYPGISAQAVAAAFPCLSPEAEKAGSGSLPAAILFPPEAAAASQPFPGQPAGLKADRGCPSQKQLLKSSQETRL